MSTTYPPPPPPPAPHLKTLTRRRSTEPGLLTPAPDVDPHGQTRMTPSTPTMHTTSTPTTTPTTTTRTRRLLGQRSFSSGASDGGPTSLGPTSTPTSTQSPSTQTTLPPTHQPTSSTPPPNNQPTSPTSSTHKQDHTQPQTHILSRFPGRNRSRSQLRSKSKLSQLSGSVVVSHDRSTSDEGSEVVHHGGGGDGDGVGDEIVDDDPDHKGFVYPQSQIGSMRKMMKSTGVGLQEPSSGSGSGSGSGQGGFSFPPQASTSTSAPTTTTPATAPPAPSLPSSPLRPSRNPTRQPIPPFSPHPSSRTPNPNAGGLFPALSRKALVLRGEAEAEAEAQAEAEVRRTSIATGKGKATTSLPAGTSSSSTQNHPANPTNAINGGMKDLVEPGLGGMKGYPAAAYGHSGGHGMFLPDLGMTFGGRPGGGGGGKKSHLPHEDHHLVNGSTGLTGQGYMPDPPMTLADRRRVNQGTQDDLEDGSGQGGDRLPKPRSGRHRFPISLSLSLHPRRRRKSADTDARRAGSRGPSRRRNKSVEPVSKSVEMSRMNMGRRRVGNGSDEVQESELDRKRREAESVIAWKVWAAACVASNTVPVDLDLFRPPTPCTTPMTSPPPHRPRLPLRPSSAGDGPPRSLYDSSSTISTEDAIVSPSTELGGPSWVAVGKRPLVHSFSMDEITGVKHVEGRNHSMPDISIEGAGEPSRSGIRSPRHRRRSTKMLVPGSLASQRTSATPTPEPPRLNPLLPLRSRLSNKHVRTIALELVHAMSSYIELRSQLDDNDAESTVTVLPPWSRRALDAARAQGLLDPPTVGETKFQDAEIIALFRDLDEVIGYPGYVRKMLASDAQFHSVVFEEPRRLAVPDGPGYWLDLATCERMLRDLEDVIWGRSEPHPDDIAYGELVLLVGTTDPSLIAAVGAQSSSAISSSLFDILAEPIPVSLSHARETEDLRETRSAAMRKQSLFANLSVSRGNSIVYVPGVSSMDIANFKIASSGRSSVDPLEQAARATPEPPKTRTAEDLAQEGRARYEAWQKSREVQPLKRA